MQTILEAGRAEKNYWRDLWRYRELFQVLAWRDLSVRYKQTIIGVAWAVIRPLLTMVVFTFVFKNVAGLPSQGATPYALMVFAGLLPWQFFSTALTDSSNSLTTNANLISKVYFPRLIVPTATIVVAVVDFLISFVLMLGMMAIYQFVPPWQIILVPFFVGLCFLTSLGPGLWITSLNVKYRDFRYVIPFIIQFGLYLTPVGFTKDVILAKIPSQFHFIYNMNPMVGVIDGFRWCLIGGPPPFLEPSFLIGIGMTLFMLWLGIRQFRKMEKTFADLI
ncbi:ABC transporter permease [Akkermansiaceae bacterium]|nr:ABC transporter permease [Akkermansiaceae bacterium]